LLINKKRGQKVGGRKMEKQKAYASDLLLGCLDGCLDSRVLVVGPKGGPLDDPNPLFFANQFHGHEGEVTAIDIKPISHRGVFCVCHGDIVLYEKTMKQTAQERGINLGKINFVIADVVEANPFPDEHFHLVIDHVTLRFIIGMRHETVYSSFNFDEYVKAVFLQYDRTLRVGGSLAFFLESTKLAGKMLTALRKLMSERYSITESTDFEDVYRVVQANEPVRETRRCLTGSQWHDEHHLERFEQVDKGFEVLWDPRVYNVKRLVLAQKIRSQS
jgi:hypothetical protein